MELQGILKKVPLIHLLMITILLSIVQFYVCFLDMEGVYGKQYDPSATQHISGIIKT